MFNAIEIRANSPVPKYKQLASLFAEGIRGQSLHREERLPSINDLSAWLDISRDTVEKAYRELRKEDLIESVPGKGYFVKGLAPPETCKIFLLFDVLNAYKKVVYDHFVKALGQQAKVDFYVYGGDLRKFEQLLHSASGNYSHYVIIPPPEATDGIVRRILECIPKGKLMLLDKRVEGFEGNCAGVYQNIERNLHDALCQMRQLLDKYHTLKLTFARGGRRSREMINGFQRFCIEQCFRGKLVSELSREDLEPGEAYITIQDEDLVCLVKKMEQADLRAGIDIGILSYDEHPLKEILLGGITVISTDYQSLGEAAGRMILEGRRGFVESPFQLNQRNSL